MHQSIISVRQEREESIGRKENFEEMSFEKKKRRLLCVHQQAVSSISLEQQQRTRAYQSMFKCDSNFQQNLHGRVRY